MLRDYNAVQEGAEKGVTAEAPESKTQLQMIKKFLASEESFFFFPLGGEDTNEDQLYSCEEMLHQVLFKI